MAERPLYARYADKLLRAPWHVRLGVASASLVFYTMAFFLLYKQWGPRTTTLSVLPIVMAGALHGVWGGLGAGLALAGLNVLLLNQVGYSGLEHILQRAGLIESLSLVVVGVGLGHLRDTGEKLWLQLQERKGDLDAIKRLAAVVKHAGDVIEITDLKGHFLYVNPAFERMMGVSLEGLKGKSSGDLLAEGGGYPPALWDMVRLGQAWRGEVLQAPGQVFETPVQGPHIPMEVTASPIHNGQGHVESLVIVKRDITQQKNAVKRLRNYQAPLQAAIESSDDAVEITGLDFKFIYVNPAWERNTGFSRDEAIGRTPAQVLGSGGQSEGYYRRLMETVRRGEVWRGEIVSERKDGAKLHQEAIISPVFDDEGRPLHYVAIKRDISQQKELEEKLRHQAFHDPLTGLSNRAHFLAQLHTAIARQRRRSQYCFAVLFLDLDRFKNVNDSLGHDAGDVLLIEIARRLTEELREIDTVSRFGGDEFAILLDEIKRDSDATKAAARIQRAICKPIHVQEHTINTSASIGISLSSAAYTEPGEILRDADTAMYRAKERGKAQYAVFDQEMHAQATALIQLERRLRDAIDEEQFCLLYQPTVDLDSGHLVGWEALLRWDTEEGLLPPSAFLTVAEESGMIIPLGWKMLALGCRQLAQWHQRFPHAADLSLSFNLSARQLAHPKLLPQIDGVLERTGLSAHHLKLEITERAFQHPKELLEPLLDGLRQRSIEVHLDDFGTGFSSLGNLHQFPVDALKIDRSFTGALLEADAKAHTLVRSILSLAHNFGLHSIAEGIESEAQRQQLSTMGCAFGQGYYFSKPLTAQEVEAQLQPGPQAPRYPLAPPSPAPESRDANPSLGS